MAKCLSSKEYNVTVVSPILESNYSPGLELGEYCIYRFDLRILRKISNNRALYRFLFTVLFTICMMRLRIRFSNKPICLVQAEQQLALLPATMLKFLCKTQLIVDDVLSTKKSYREHLGVFESIITKIEKTLFQKCSLIIASDSGVARAVSSSGYLPNSRIQVIPNGVEHVNLHLGKAPRNIKTKDIVFVGSMYNEQNRRAVCNLIQMFPSVTERVRNARLVIIGGPVSLLEKTLEGFNRGDVPNNVKIMGYVPEIEKNTYMLGASVCALPFDSQDSLIGGIRLKALDCLSYGKILVSTPSGIAGIEGAVSGENMIVACDLDLFKECLVDVLERPENYEQFGKNALKLAAKYQWNNILRDYLSIVEHLTT